MAVLHNSTQFEHQGGQHSQDIFLFHNLYKYWPMTGRKGFYVESGAYDALYLSTSLFFDKCLGWDGLCVEPQEKFHKVITQICLEIMNRIDDMSTYMLYSSKQQGQ